MAVEYQSPRKLERGREKKTCARFLKSCFLHYLGAWNKPVKDKVVIQPTRDRTGSPIDEVMSHHELQSSSQEFKDFAEGYRFTLRTTITRYSKAGALPEKAVQTIKRKLWKGGKSKQDPHLTLLG